MSAPILLTAERDILSHYPDSCIDDSKSLGLCVGVHAICNGFVDRKASSRRCDALYCRACGLRVSVPADVITYGDLRAQMTYRLKDIIPYAEWPGADPQIAALLPRPGERVRCTRPYWLYEVGMEGEVVPTPSWKKDREPGTLVVIPNNRFIGSDPRWLKHGEVGSCGAWDVVNT